MLPPASQLPTLSASFSTATPTSTQAAPTDAEQTWIEQPLGADALTVTFFTDASGSPCLRYVVNARSSSACAPSKRSTLAALQGVETDSSGTVYSIIAGRTLSDQITAVSIEFSDGDNSPAQVEDGGFLVILPGKRSALRAVPIDQYGNLVGDKFTFNR
jgi:hypothetical protein